MEETREQRIYRLRWWTLVTISASVLVIVLDATVMNIALPTIQRELNATGTELLWMVNVYTLILGALMIATGFFGDRFGRGRILQLGLVVFGIASIGAFLSRTPMQLIVARVFMGTGAAMILPSTLSTLTAVFPEKERGQAIGVWAGLNAIGIALGPIISGVLVENFQWYSIFAINIPVVIIALILGWFFVPDTRDAHPHSLDVPGNLLAIIGLAALTYGLINGGSRGWTDGQVLGTLLGSAVVLALFVWWERRADEPLLDLGFFRNAGFSAGVSALIILGLAFNGVAYVLTFFMQFVQGDTPIGAGVRFVPFAGGMLIGAVMADRFVKKTSGRTVMTVGFIGTAVALLFTSFLKIDSSFWFLGFELGFLGLFLGAIVAPVTDVIMGSLPLDKAGIGSAINTTFRMVAGTIGVAVLGSILGSIYTSHFTSAASAVTGLPAAVVKAGSDSIGAALGVAASGQLPADLAATVAQLGRQSFMDGWGVIMLISVAVFLVGAGVVAVFMPKRGPTPPAELGDREHLERHAGMQ